MWTLQGQTNNTGGGLIEAAPAATTWNAEPHSTINYTIGSGSANIISLDAGSSPCGWNTCIAGGGVIGCGGASGGGTHMWRGESYVTITGGAVWLRAYCSLNAFDSITTQAVLTHELGHTLGLGHPDQMAHPGDECPGDEHLAQMRSSCSTVRHWAATIRMLCGGCTAMEGGPAAVRRHRHPLRPVACPICE